MKRSFKNNRYYDVDDNVKDMILNIIFLLITVFIIAGTFIVFLGMIFNGR